MKKYLLVFSFMLVLLGAMAQAPQAINYQMTVRNSSGQYVSNQNISIQFSFKEDQANGTIVYAEDHLVTTSSEGLVNVVMGQGSGVLGSFNSIDWEHHDYFLGLGVDLNGGSNFTSMGTVQLVSVPYALLARDVINKDDADPSPTNELQTLSLNGSFLTLSNSGTSINIAIYTAGNGISISSGNVITNTAPDIPINLTGSGNISVTGTYPSLNVHGTDNVNDADSSPTNELQNLTLNGNNLSLTPSGGTITLPNNSYWGSGSTVGTIWNINPGYVGVNYANPQAQLHVSGSVLFTGGDGNVNTTLGVDAGDHTKIRYYLENIGGVLLTEAESAAADIDGNGSVNRDDLAIVKDMVFFSGTKADGIRKTSNLYGAMDGDLNTFKVNGSMAVNYGTTINELSIDGTLSGNSDSAVPTEKAVKTYVDNAVSGGGSSLWSQSGTNVYYNLGNVGIGVSSPTEKLHVNGWGYFTTAGGLAFRQDKMTKIYGSSSDLYLEAKYGSTGDIYLEASDDVEITAPSVFEVNALTGYLDCDKVGIDYSSPTYKLQLPNYSTTSGKGLAYSWNSYSDSRIKSNQKILSGALNTVMQLAPKSYDYHDVEVKDSVLVIGEVSKVNDIGFIAQELYEVIPQMVEKPENEESELWSVDYQKLIPVLTRAMQEQQELIEGQQKEMEVLKAELERLRLLLEK